MNVNPREALVVLLGPLVAACAGPVPAMAPTHIEQANRCTSIDFDRSGDVRLCGGPFARWSGRTLTMLDGREVFAIDGDALVFKDRPGVRLSGDAHIGRTPVDGYVRVTLLGEVLDGRGEHVATIWPVPQDDRVLLVAMAAMAQGIAVSSAGASGGPWGPSLSGNRIVCSCPK